MCVVKRKSNPAKAFISKRQKNKKKRKWEKSFQRANSRKNFLFSNGDI